MSPYGSFISIGVVAGIVFTAPVKEAGDVVRKLRVANVSHVDPGMCNTKTRFIYGVVKVEGAEVKIPYILEQVAYIFVIHFFPAYVCMLFFGWYV